MQFRAAIGAATAATVALAWTAAGEAAENASNVYLLGLKTAMAGFVPPPGTYVSDLNYYYSGSAGGQAAVGIALRQLGAVLDIEADVQIDATAYVNAPIGIWVAPEKVLGGNVGFGVMAPFGSKTIDVALDAHVELTLPNGTVVEADRHFEYDEDSFKFGDPLLNALIGWHQGNWHWSLNALLNVPIGQWDTDSITNMSFNRWALDISGAATWLDAAQGHEVSVAAGFTFNGENPATDYRTGTEFHVEWALMQHVSKTTSFGLGGYHYQQITGDSGAGATLGDFKGRISGVGPVLTHTFQVGKIPVSTQLEYMHEFNAKNRAEGDVGILNITVPLSVGR